MTVEEAREKGVCRICGANVRIAGPPLGWETEFGERIHPPPVLVLNFGDEFAHQHCLERESDSTTEERQLDRPAEGDTGQPPTP